MNVDREISAVQLSPVKKLDVRWIDDKSFTKMQICH